MISDQPVTAPPLGPLPARLRHGPVELVPETIKDTAGAPSQPYRASDCVESLLRRGSITREMANAADTFRDAFRVAHMDPLRAADMSRVPGSRGRAVDPPVWARRRVQDAITALGGLGRAPGSCAWHVIGLEWSIGRWAREEFGRDSRTATGVLIATLAFLDAIYSGRPSAV